jgi:glucosinolate gamma-glutamyl hydrolase
MIASTPISPRVAIVRNYALNASHGPQMHASLAELVYHVHPDATVKHYAPIDGGDVPDSAHFDLAILTGGTWDITKPEDEFDLWVAKEVAWIRRTVRDHPKTKLLGICWGHQVITRALGGIVVYSKDGVLVDYFSQNREWHKLTMIDRCARGSFD